VFLETSGGIRRQFVGMAPPGVVLWSLAMRYPWLESALAKAYSSEAMASKIQSVHGALERVMKLHGRLGPFAISVSRIPKPFLIEFITRSRSTPKFSLTY
jgi:hypothetical protein